MDEQQQIPSMPTPAPLPPVPGDMRLDPTVKSSSRRKRAGLALGLICLLFGAGFLIWLYALPHHKNILPEPDNSLGLVKPDPQAARTDTPLGQTVQGSGDIAGLAVKVEQVILAPATTGDKPELGSKYLEIDLSISNSGRNQTIVPGTFIYQTADGKLFYIADAAGKTPQYANKNVQVTGKQPLDALSLDGGQTDDTHYLIFQVPANQPLGKLLWYNGYYDTQSIKLAIFDLS